MADTMREGFEARMRTLGRNDWEMRRHVAGETWFGSHMPDYCDDNTQALWRGWQFAWPVAHEAGRLLGMEQANAFWELAKTSEAAGRAGHCALAEGQCNCGGDLPRIRAGCHNWRPASPQPAAELVADAARRLEMLNHVERCIRASTEFGLGNPAFEHATTLLHRLKEDIGQQAKEQTNG